MNTNTKQDRFLERLKLSSLSFPAKALLTAIILTMSLAMVGALGQIVVHDIIPTFFSGKPAAGHMDHSSEKPAESSDSADARGERGDLFGGPAVEEPAPKQAFYKTEQFVWLLKWTHIHLFGMNMIFIFMGGIALLLNLKGSTRAWLITLPFIGILVDILGLWLKSYVSPHFFWLHVPGGLVFGGIFLFVSVKALLEMWLKPN